MAEKKHSSTVPIHALNTCIACLCAIVLGLTAYSVSAKGSFENDVPPSTRSIGMSILFWPGVGGLVDALLFTIVWLWRPSNDDPVSLQS